MKMACRKERATSLLPVGQKVMARELVEKDEPTVILATTISAVRAAQAATSSVPIVMASINDPVGNGLVESLARLGGNTTGLATLNQDLSPKLLEIVSALLPHAATAAVLYNPANPSNPAYVNSIRAEAERFRIAFQAFELKGSRELEGVFGALAAQKLDTLIVINDVATLDLGDRIAPLALKHHIPIVSANQELTVVGGLISYGAPRRENYRRAAYFIRKIFDGAKPAPCT